MGCVLALVVGQLATSPLVLFEQTMKEWTRVSLVTTSFFTVEVSEALRQGV